MSWFFVRHAEAVDERRDLTDPQRYVSPAGRRQAVALGERLRWHDCTPAMVWTSPLCRALQTAELIVGVLGGPEQVLVEPLLAPDGNLKILVERLRQVPAGQHVLMVGHEPGMSGLLGMVIGDPHVAALRKAEAVRVDAGAVRWRFAHDDEAPQR